MKTVMQTFMAGLAVALVLMTSPGHAQEISLVADVWCPVNCEPGSEKPGYAVELAKAIFEPEGYTVTYVTRPWKRAQKETKEGRFSALLAATDEDGLTFPAEPIGILDNDFYTLTHDTWRYRDPDSLIGETLGIISGYQYGEIDPLIHSNQVKAYGITGDNLPSRSINMLLEHRVRIIVDWNIIIEHAARHKGVSQRIQHVGRGGNRLPIYIAFTDNRKHLAPLWDQGMKKLKETGELANILARYQLTPEDCGLSTEPSP